MGDRVSIQFKNSGMKYASESVVLFHHWGGKDFPRFANAWVEDFKTNVLSFNKNSKGNDPVTRLEPQNIMVQFVKYLSDYKGTTFKYGHYEKEEYVYSDEVLSYSIYFGKDENDGDNSDNGHHVIELS